MRRSFRAALLSSVALMAIAGTAAAQSDPPGRVGRLAYLQGAVSYHDAQADSWSQAALNTPLSTGDALWTEPSGHDEVQIGGTRVRMDGDTQLDLLAVDDSQTKLQLDQGRLDIRAFQLDNNQPYTVVTPRGTVTLQQQGDYYIHAGTSDDPTLIGVRAGSVEVQTPGGESLTVNAGQEAQIRGDGSSFQVQAIQSAPPAMPAYWAQRDQLIHYDDSQYLSDDMTGYADLAAYGTWAQDPEYGEVWTPNGLAADWQPYTDGYWAYSDPYGWNWVGAEPWGFAPYHYGRWAQRDHHWFWVPPDRHEHAVYAPALVAFVGGTELGVALGAQNRAPVGWFPLGPHEAYVPPYARDRAYYERMNRADHVPAAAMNDRWQHAERHEALRANAQNEPMMNRRFATVVSAEDFAHSRPVQQVRLHVAEDKIASAPVAAVSAPPSPTHSLAQQAPAQGQQANRANEPAGHETRFGNMQEIARPQPQHTPAPGPNIAAHTPGEPGHAQHPGMPPLPQANHAEQRPGEPARPGEPRPGEPRANVQPGAQPQAQHAEPQHPEAQRPGEPPHAPAPAAQQAQHPEVQHPGEPPRAPAPPAAQQAQHPEPQHQAEPPHAPAPAAQQAQHPEPQHPAAVPQQAQHPIEPKHPAAPAPQAHPAEAPHPMPQAAPPQQAHAPAPPPHPAAPPPQAAPHPAAAPPPPAPHPAPQQAQAPHPAPAPAPQAAPHPAPAPAPQKQEEKKP
ncbi:MAG TPA: DUF6600 domain-containing protein [Reyranella sp.]|nr:DUF6600 domain-containing protein [Reyranella sp.]